MVGEFRDQLADADRAQRSTAHHHAEPLQRILDGIGDGGGRTDGPAFAEPFDAQRVAGRQALDVIELDRGHVGGDREGVVLQGAGQRLTAFVVDDLLVQHAAQSLHDAAHDLRIREQWVDHPSTIVDDDVALDLDGPGFLIDRNDRGVRGAGVGYGGWAEVRCLGEQAVARGALPEDGAGRRLRDLRQGQGALRNAFDPHLSVDELEIVRRSLQ